MESPTVVDEERSHSQVSKDEGSRKGGLITMPFILVNESLEKMASYGLQSNMITYLTKEYRMSLARGTNVLNLWSAATNFMPILGAFIADSFLGRFLTIALGSFSCFLGVVLLWLTAMIPGWKPSSPWGSGSGGGRIKGESATAAQYAVLAVAFALMSIGAGGVRPCSQAFGADQLHINKRDNTTTNNNNKEERALEIFFNWYYACSCLSVLIGVTVIVYIQVNAGWRVGLGIPALLLLASIFSFFAASSFYVKVGPLRSLFTSFAHVVVAAYRNRHLQLSPNSRYHQQQQNCTHMQAALPSKYIRALNKACLLSGDCSSSENHPWRLTTVDQVEELKALIRVLPIWSSGIMLSINVNQGTFQVYQANAMDRHLGSGFEVPAASIGMFLILAIVVWVPLYDRLIIPMAYWMKGRPVRISVKLRMGVGLFFTMAAMAVAALVETARRGRAGPPMSAFWLVPQYALNGIGEALNVIGQTEFYYSEFPKTMSSIATALSGMGMAVASVLATAIVSAVNAGTSWVGDDPNKAHYDYYYWILAGLSFLNLGYYMFGSWAYGPCKCQGDTKDAHHDADSHLQP